MNLQCQIFGHKLPSGYCGGKPYLRIRNIVTDGIERRHAFLYGLCDRCDVEYLVAYTHLPKDEDKKEGEKR